MGAGAMRVSGALRHVDHLATLGLDPHIAIPEMLRTLTATAPGARTRFAWVGDDGRIEDACCVEVGASPARGEVRRAELELRLLRAGRTVALVSVERGVPFSERERGVFRAALPMLQRAMTHVPRLSEQFDDMPELTGVLVCSATGRLVSADARALLLVAEMDGRPLVGTDVAAPAEGERLPSFIGDALRGGLASAASRQVERVSRWGAFRAQIFAQVTGGDASSHVIVVSKYLPRRVALMRTLERLDLSPRERQVAFHLGNGANAAAGATAMGVSVTTWRTYVKRVYVRLDARDRFDLLNKLNVRVAA